MFQSPGPYPQGDGHTRVRKQSSGVCWEEAWVLCGVGHVCRGTKWEYMSWAMRALGTKAGVKLGGQAVLMPFAFTFSVDRRMQSLRISNSQSPWLSSVSLLEGALPSTLPVVHNNRNQV